MSKFIELEVKKKKYLIGFSNRMSVVKAEEDGFYEALQNAEKNPVSSSAEILKAGLREKQPEMTIEDVNQLIEDITEENENSEEVILIADIVKFIVEEYMGFSGTPTGNKKTKKLKIVEK